MNRLTIFVCGVFLAASVGCGDHPPVPDQKPANVVFVVVDTLRADHTSLHGYDRATTPNLEALAADSIVFERARSQAGCTFPSANSYLTSRYAFDFYRRVDEGFGIPEDYPSIAEILQSAGYTTAAVSASPIVRSTPSDKNPTGGFGRGFDTFDESCLWKPARCVTRRALEIAKSLPEPYFLYLHYMDPHDFYQPPNGFRHFAGDYEGFDFIAAGNPNPIGEMLYNDGPAIELGDDDIQHLIDLYDDEILYFDTTFATLVDWMKIDGVYDRTLVVITADHGEEFLEHGHVKHCRGVWNTLTHVPLLLHPPGGGPARRYSGAVQLVDLVPTVIDIVDIDAVDADLVGRSLLPVLDSPDGASGFAFSDQTKYRGVDDGRFHLILDGRESTLALYDTHIDPLETDDLYASTHPCVDTLTAELNSWLDRTGQWVHFETTLAASKAQEEQLRALGYLE
ncbi:MAG: sulfatase [Thermoanaerobaculales bacterium]|jgi:arylsulfatase A-like enzyme|nr:sulfatase [Thermoanaerobaculales bacterium]